MFLRVLHDLAHVAEEVLVEDAVLAGAARAGGDRHEQHGEELKRMTIADTIALKGQHEY